MMYITFHRLVLWGKNLENLSFVTSEQCRLLSWLWRSHWFKSKQRHTDEGPQAETAVHICYLLCNPLYHNLSRNYAHLLWELDCSLSFCNNLEYLWVTCYLITLCQLKQKNLIPVLSSARSLRQYTFSTQQAFWPSCHSDVGGSRHGWGGSRRTNCFSSPFTE